MTIDIPFTRHVLSNGLTVLIHEDHRCPIVAVNIWYHVGSKDERPGRTGFAHLFEHLMFEGSEHYDHGYFQPLQEAGALLNGSTDVDRTNYWEVVPSNALELALWMESDRMGNLLPALTQAKFDNQRDVVLNERRQNYENRPYGLASIAIGRTLYPTGHPYHWPTIGIPEDLTAATLDEVRAFFRSYYHPRNGSLSLAGAVETEAVLPLVEAYFGGIAPGLEPARLNASAGRANEARVLLEDRVELPRLYLAWLSPAIFASGDAELDLAADLLAGGKSSRLYRRLVYERRIATEVAAAQNSQELSGFFEVVATAAPGHNLAELDEAISDVLGEFLADGPTSDELERSAARAEAHFVYRLQTVGGFGGKSDQLNAYNVYLGQPGFFERDLLRYRNATVESIRDSSRAWLTRSSRVCLSVVPRQRTDLAVADSIPVTVW